MTAPHALPAQSLAQAQLTSLVFPPEIWSEKVSFTLINRQQPANNSSTPQTG